MGQITVTIRRPDQPAESYTIVCQDLAKKIEELVNYKANEALAKQSQKGWEDYCESEILL